MYTGPSFNDYEKTNELIHFKFTADLQLKKERKEEGKKKRKELLPFFRVLNQSNHFFRPIHFIFTAAFGLYNAVFMCKYQSSTSNLKVILNNFLFRSD